MTQPPQQPPFGQYPGGHSFPPGGGFPPPKKSRKGWIIAVAVIGVLVVLGAVARVGVNVVADRQATAFEVGDCLEAAVPSGSVPLSELDSVPTRRDCADERAIYEVANTGSGPDECGVFDSVLSRDGKALCLMANFHEGRCYAVSEVGVEIVAASCAVSAGESGADMVIRVVHRIDDPGGASSCDEALAPMEYEEYGRLYCFEVL